MVLRLKSPVSLSQITPIARITEETQVMVVPANSPIKTAKDLAEAVKKDVAKVTFAGGSAGGVDHIMAALFVGAIRFTTRHSMPDVMSSGEFFSNTPPIVV